MAQQTVLEVAPRSVLGKATKRLRREGFIPANIYGHKEASLAVQIEAGAFERLRKEHGLRNAISLRLPQAASQTVLVRHIQHDAITGHIIHVDFSRVNLSETIESKIPVHFVGEAPGVKIEGGVLLHLLESLPVECKVSDIVSHLEVDVAALTEIGSILHASDVKLPAGYKLALDPDEPIAKIDAPRVEAPTVEETAAETAVPATEQEPES